MERYPLTRSLRVYWLNVLAIALTPTMTVMAMICFKPLWPIVFLAFGIFGIVVPYRFGKAPVSYLITCQLVFVLGGFGMALIALTLLALGVPEELLDKWWAETRN